MPKEIFHYDTVNYMSKYMNIKFCWVLRSQKWKIKLYHIKKDVLKVIFMLSQNPNNTWIKVWC